MPTADTEHTDLESAALEGVRAARAIKFPAASQSFSAFTLNVVDQWAIKAVENGAIASPTKRTRIQFRTVRNLVADNEATVDLVPMKGYDGRDSNQNAI